MRKPKTPTLALPLKRLECLVGLLDLSVKTLGLRAMEPDVIDLIDAVRAAAEQEGG